MSAESIQFDVYLPATGNPLAESRDGSLTIRLAVSPCDRDAVHALIDAMRVLGGMDDDGNVVHLLALEVPRRQS